MDAEKPIQLECLPASLFSAPESIREFIVDGSFDDLAYLVECMVEDAKGADDATKEERLAGWRLVRDLHAVAKAAATGASVEVEAEAHRRGEALQSLATLARYAMRCDLGADAAGVLLGIIVDHVAADSEAPPVAEGAR